MLADDEFTHILPWALTAAGGVATVIVALVTALWNSFKRRDAQYVGGLKADLVSARESVTRLGEKLDLERRQAKQELEDERRAHVFDNERTAHAIARASSAEQVAARSWEEFPTSVRDRMELIAQAAAPPEKKTDLFADLEGWTPTSSHPPPSKKPT
jgi:hypothetical protein